MYSALRSSAAASFSAGEGPDEDGPELQAASARQIPRPAIRMIFLVMAFSSSTSIILVVPRPQRQVHKGGMRKNRSRSVFLSERRGLRGTRGDGRNTRR